jgi:hypothetical protein
MATGRLGAPAQHPSRVAPQLILDLDLAHYCWIFKSRADRPQKIIQLIHVLDAWRGSHTWSGFCELETEHQLARARRIDD